MRRKTEGRRLAILDAGLVVFREFGFERTTIGEICRRIGFSTATLYNYFPTKKALFIEVMHKANEAEVRAIRCMLDHPAVDIAGALQHFGERLLTLIYTPDVLAVRRMMSSAYEFGEFGRDLFERGPKKILKYLAEFLMEAMNKGQLRRSDPLVATHQLRALLESELRDSFMCRTECDHRPQNIKRVVERAVTFFMSAYEPTAPVL